MGTCFPHRAVGFETSLSSPSAKETAMVKRKKKLEFFYMLTKKMVDSKAWAKLDSYDKEIFIHIAIKYNGKNKNDLSLTYEDAKHLQSEHRFKKSIDHLVKYLDAVPATLDDPLVFQKGEMLGDRCLGKLQAFPDFLDVATFRHQAGDNFKPDRVAEDLEDFRLPLKILGFVEI